ncbi:hypothetical protein H2199_004978 [Coniosporium tulheliwenetii]|uniref:Uncharacterized protein n=1 Tax=Coniosporium tulheliwenetii TaxID=3383036 RepID=A0ACC2Z297_9PEZI|nr:hypothetical protein H2199_004978 [Cladosporium sp. JES 115]
MTDYASSKPTKLLRALKVRIADLERQLRDFQASLEREEGSLAQLRGQCEGQSTKLEQSAENSKNLNATLEEERRSAAAALDEHRIKQLEAIFDEIRAYKRALNLGDDVEGGDEDQGAVYAVQQALYLSRGITHRTLQDIHQLTLGADALKQQIEKSKEDLSGIRRQNSTLQTHITTADKALADVQSKLQQERTSKEKAIADLEVERVRTQESCKTATSRAKENAERQKAELRSLRELVGSLESETSRRLASYLIGERRRALTAVQIAREAVQDVEFLRGELAAVKGTWAAANARVAAAMTG